MIFDELTVSGKERGADLARSSWVEPGPLGLVLAALMPANRLVMEVMIQTGLRVSDVLRLTKKQVERGRFTIRELKTGKTRRIYLPRALQLRLLQQAGRLWCFEGRADWRKPRSRQAVYKDVKRAAGMFARTGKLERDCQVSPHSARKVYAVEKYRETGSLEKVSQALNHDPGHIAVTMLYALSDKVSAKELAKLAERRK